MGSDAALVCTAEVVKASVVTFEWLDQLGTDIVSSENIKVSSTSKLSDNVFQSTLEFRGVLPSIAGLYFCTAKLNTTSVIDYYYVDTHSGMIMKCSYTVHTYISLLLFVQCDGDIVC